MSPSEHTTAQQMTDLTRQLTEVADQANAGALAEVSEQALRSLVSATIRLYAAASEASTADIDPLEDGVSTTDAVVMACALLKARELNPFDLALWFSRTRVAG
jgi:hypothetical protein